MMTKTTHDFYYSFGNVVVVTLKLIVEAIAVGIIVSNQISFCFKKIEEVLFSFNYKIKGEKEGYSTRILKFFEMRPKSKKY